MNKIKTTPLAPQEFEVEQISENNLLSKGAGHCVYIVSKNKGLGIHEAGLELQEGNYIDYLMEYFKVYE